MIAAVGISVLSFGLFLALYTAYDKKTKTLKPEMLNKIFFEDTINNFRNFLTEMNKVLALNGLTVIGLAYILPVVRLNLTHELLCSGLLQISVHTALSYWIYYGQTKFQFITKLITIQKLQASNIKTLSIWLGVAANLTLWIYWLRFIDGFVAGFVL